jgi:YD repeat-containing protein
VVKEIDPLGKATLFSYDAVGNLTSTTRPRGDFTETEDDALNRPVAVSDADGNWAIRQFDPAGNVRVDLRPPRPALNLLSQQQALCGKLGWSAGPAPPLPPAVRLPLPLELRAHGLVRTRLPPSRRCPRRPFANTQRSAGSARPRPVCAFTHGT